MISEGEVLVIIDPTEYELTTARQEASLYQIKTMLVELDVQANNTQGSLMIEQCSLVLAEQIPQMKQTAFE